MATKVRKLTLFLLPAIVLSSMVVRAGAAITQVNGQFAIEGAAAHQLSDSQMDMVTAGQILGVECPGCTLASSSSTSTNGITTSMSSSGLTPGAGTGTGGGGSTSGGGGSTSGSGGSTGGSGGSTSAGPSVLTSAPLLPANLAAILSAATTIVKP
jgi:hypothetical protein